jgi:hypothetical protein
VVVPQPWVVLGGTPVPGFSRWVLGDGKMGPTWKGSFRKMELHGQKFLSVGTNLEGELQEDGEAEAGAGHDRVGGGCQPQHRMGKAEAANAVKLGGEDGGRRRPCLARR